VQVLSRFGWWRKLSKGDGEVRMIVLVGNSFFIAAMESFLSFSNTSASTRKTICRRGHAARFSCIDSMGSFLCRGL
jgi:hypothetical protein